jgi:hypothetical protein
MVTIGGRVLTFYLECGIMHVKEAKQCQTLAKYLKTR